MGAKETYYVEYQRSLAWGHQKLGGRAGHNAQLVCVCVCVYIYIYSMANNRKTKVSLILTASSTLPEGFRQVSMLASNELTPGMEDADFHEQPVDHLEVVLELAEFLSPLSTQLQPHLELLLHLRRYTKGGEVRVQDLGFRV